MEDLPDDYIHAQLVRQEEIKKKQDEGLDRVIIKLDDLEEVAIDIGKEINGQQSDLNNLDYKTNVVTNKLNDTNSKLRNFLDNNCLVCLGLTFIVVFIILLIIVCVIVIVV